jgi:predicted ATPase
LSKPFILTGAPGAGKTVVLRQLEAMGHAVVEEAATDVIALAQAKGVAQPHLDPAFIDAIVTLQERRRRRSASPPLLGEGDPEGVEGAAAAEILSGAPPSPASPGRPPEGEEKRLFRAPTTFHDRSPICTLALAHYLGFPVSGVLTRALRSIEAQQFYARRVFFLRNLGFIVNTEARRISFEDTLRFEQVHEDVYRQLGYELVFIDAAEVEERAGRVIALASGA